MRAIAMYLPQFHRVPENDKWWGDGFTDWVSTKKAQPLFEGHYQPHIPMNKNYYDLMDKSTMEWQAELMKKNGVDGICMYHYWFEDGKKMLEKPAENLLEWKDIDMPFCFCWDSSAWARSWSNIDNALDWIYEKDKQDLSDGKLINQKYGFYEQWENHFNYLLPFFLDKRYIKIDERPVFVFFVPHLVYCLEEMLTYWRNLAHNVGIKEPYFIGVVYNPCDIKKNIFDGYLFHAPSYYILDRLKNGILEIYDYQKIWNQVLEIPYQKNNIFFGGFVNYDDTPRRGKEGNIVEGGTPSIFAEMMIELFAKNYVSNGKLTFINAWNEWGEGMHLEPDMKEKTGYLEAISYAKQNFKNKIEKYKNIKIEDFPNENLLAIKYKKDLYYLDIWMELRERKISIKQYFEKYHLKKVLIYGYGIFTKHLIQELEEEDIMILGIIDQKKEKIGCKYPTYYPYENLPDHDVIVITPLHCLSEIIKELPNEKVISIKSILRELYE